MAAHVGRAETLAALVEAPAHSLTRQSYAHREMRGATVNADGWGAAWYLDTDQAACSYRTIHPIWADSNRDSIGRTVVSRCVLAAVRSATDPLGLAVANTQPFVDDTVSFMHNGYLRGFRSRLMRPMREALSDTAYAALRGDTDSELLFATLLDAHRQHGTLCSAVAETVPRILSLARQHDVAALITLVVADGSSLVAVRAAAADEPPTLYVDEGEFGTRVASEPLDDSRGWRPLTPNVVYEARRGALQREPLP